MFVLLSFFSPTTDRACPLTTTGLFSSLRTPYLSPPPPPPLARSYLGNCPEGVTEQQLFKFVTDAMNLAKLTVGDNPNPVVQVRVNGRFAFAEFRSVDECNNGLNLNGIELGGTQLRVGRPKAYDGPTVPHGTWSELIAKGLDAIKAQGVPGSGGMPGGYGGQFGASAPLSAGAGLMPTNVLQLANMVTAEELADDEEYAVSFILYFIFLAAAADILCESCSQYKYI